MLNFRDLSNNVSYNKFNSKNLDQLSKFLVYELSNASSNLASTLMTALIAKCYLTVISQALIAVLLFRYLISRKQASHVLRAGLIAARLRCIEESQHAYT